MALGGRPSPRRTACTHSSSEPSSQDGRRELKEGGERENSSVGSNGREDSIIKEKKYTSICTCTPNC